RRRAVHAVFPGAVRDPRDVLARGLRPAEERWVRQPVTDRRGLRIRLDGAGRAGRVGGAERGGGRAGHQDRDHALSATKTDTAFGDTSAVALLCTHQPATGEARRIAQRCGRIVLWWGTPVEAKSAFVRLHRESWFVCFDRRLADAADLA